ncbi:NAD-dependent epimerase/dehydratase family protein [Nocardioides plantarum]|uniref:NAD-dependent epimerase/dehydratase family protein n=1 Tax=Nocardioides plantarum TaxID=29299 RepID=A0ABV5K8D1_9ACTN|nr:GDP-mannose 4,6-dehydratase [Nocardioides plantarum]
MERSNPAAIAVTGVNGFVGGHVAKDLRRHGYRVIGIGRDDAAVQPEDLDEYWQADLTQTWPDVGDVDGVIHLAGLAAVGASFEQPDEYLRANGAMMLRLGEAALGGARLGRVVLASTGAVYDARSPMPLTESSAVGMTSPYVVSKLLMENIGTYFSGRGVDVVVARPFNHSGPGQTPGFLIPDLARGIQKAVADGDLRLMVGDLGTSRDYTDVRDVASAYRLLVSAPSLDRSVYNICSGSPVSGREVLEMVLDAMGAESMTVSTDESRIRPNDPRSISGDSSRIRTETGWCPSIALKDTVRDFVAALEDR